MSSISTITREAYTSFTNTMEKAYQNIQKQASRFCHIAKENPKSAMGLAAAAIAALSVAAYLQLNSDGASDHQLTPLESKLVQAKLEKSAAQLNSDGASDHQLTPLESKLVQAELEKSAARNGFLSNIGKETLAQQALHAAQKAIDEQSPVTIWCFNLLEGRVLQSESALAEAKLNISDTYAAYQNISQKAIEEQCPVTIGCFNLLEGRVLQLKSALAEAKLNVSDTYAAYENISKIVRELSREVIREKRVN